MKVTYAMARETGAKLESLKRARPPKDLPSTSEWERKRKCQVRRFLCLMECVDAAASALKVKKGPGRPHVLPLAARAKLAIIQTAIGASSRRMEMTVAVGHVLGVSPVSYRTILRFYEDTAVRLVLFNAFVLMQKKSGVSGHLAGDGTGYSLSVKNHYSANPNKRNKAYRYSFALTDVESGLYVAYGYSSRSETDAFRKAMDMVRGLGVRILSIRLDKHYSNLKKLREFKGATPYVIPLKNIRTIGPVWREIIIRAREDMDRFLDEYNKRNICETCFSADKNRFGRKLRQVKEVCRETALQAVALLQNVFMARVGS